MIFRITLALVAFGMFLTSCGQTEKKETEKQEARPAANDLPAMQVVTTDNTPVALKTLRGKVIIVMFQPDCDHCQREAKQFHENLAAFKAYQLYFVSSASAAELTKFATEYKLVAPNIHFATATVEQVLATYGPIDAPSVYLYDTNGKLVQQFNGEVDLSVVLKYL